MRSSAADKLTAIVFFHSTLFSVFQFLKNVYFHFSFSFIDVISYHPTYLKHAPSYCGISIHILSFLVNNFQLFLSLKLPSN